MNVNDIKFRAWHKKLQQMFIVNSLQYRLVAEGNKPYKPELYSVELYRECEIHMTINAYPEDIVLMAYTGLNDLNGNEIYDDDIIVKENRYDYIPNHGLVDSAVTVKKEVVEGSDDMGIDTYGYPAHYESFVIIGNIYENPVKKIDECKIDCYYCQNNWVHGKQCHNLTKALEKLNSCELNPSNVIEIMKELPQKCGCFEFNG